jgi:hypothetical protein
LISTGTLSCLCTGKAYLIYGSAVICLRIRVSQLKRTLSTTLSSNQIKTNKFITMTPSYLE